MNDPHTRHPLTERNASTGLNHELVKKFLEIRATMPHYPDLLDFERHTKVARLNCRTYPKPNDMNP